MFSQRNNPYCELILNCKVKISGFKKKNKFFRSYKKKRHINAALIVFTTE